MKYCQKCGKEIEDNATFCPSCGARVDGVEVVTKTANIKEKSIVTCIILSILTCGIYTLIWMAKETDDANKVYSKAIEVSGGTVVLLTLVTCGIYGFYWAYKMGKAVDSEKGGESNSILYLLVYFLAGIITLAIFQNELNEHAA